MASKIDKYLNIKNCSCEKLLTGKLVLACDEIEWDEIEWNIKNNWNLT